MLLGIALLMLGGVICVANFYLSFPRYLLHRLSGGTREDYGWISGVPVFGSLFVAISLVWGWNSTAWFRAAFVLILIDTGGLHWFAGTMIWFGGAAIWAWLRSAKRPP